MSQTYTSLISTAELADLIHTTDNDGSGITIIDASMGIDPASDTPHIADAQYFNIDDVADPNASLPHTAPSPELFEAKVQAMGINQNDQIIIYDKTGVAMAACRVWWMFRLYGHDNVAVLNGGLPAWAGAGFDIVNAPFTPAPQQGNFKSHHRPHLIRTADQVKENITTEQHTTIDARSPAHFAGFVGDPRANNAAGHIPKSCNLPFMALLDEDGKFKPDNDIKQIISQVGFDLEKPVITSCGSGVTACVVALALFRLGLDNVAVFDGSWTEWGQLNYPVESVA